MDDDPNTTPPLPIASEGTTYVIGHKNPDADAICSAIAYADLKKRTGHENYIPARCGNSNARIDSILGRFDVPLPTFLGDVRPRARDVMSLNVKKVRIDATCAEALELIDQYDVRALPVVTEEDRVCGFISIFSLGEYFIPKARNSRETRHVRTSVSDIVRSLNAQVLHLTDEDRLEDLYVRVGAMDIRSFGRFAETEDIPAAQSIIVVGDRWDIQQKSIQSGVRLLVITGSLEVAPEVLDMAKERGVPLIVSPYDSATTSWVIRTANRLDRLVVSDFVSFSPDEPLSNVRRKIAQVIAPVYVVADEDGKLAGVLSKTDVLKPPRTRLALVDHNEVSQAVPGASEVTISEIVDHHRLGNPPTNQPILFINEPVGSTCTIIADLYRRHGLEPDPGIAGIMMGGIISDTLLLQSPTSTAKDEEILKWLAKIASTDPQDLADIIFSSGSVILNSDPEAVIRSDMKAYEEGEVKFSVSQVEELGYRNFWSNYEAMEEALEKVREEEDFLFSGLLITDINRQDSLLLIKGSRDLIQHISYPLAERDDVFEMSGIVSRKKQVIPYLTSILRQAGLVPAQAS